MRARLIAWLVPVAVVVAGCSVGAEDDATLIAAEDVPYGLLEVTEPGTSSTVPDGARVVVYLVADGRLVEVDRQLPPGADPGDVVALLADGATEDEVALGLTSAVSDPEALLDVAVVRGLAEVDLGEPFSDLDASDQGLAIAQTVFTLTARPGIGGVRFTLEGASVQVPRGDGSLTGDALARDDFPGLLAGS